MNWIKNITAVFFAIVMSIAVGEISIKNTIEN